MHTSKDLSQQEMDDLSSLRAVLYPKREFAAEGADRLIEVLAIAGIGK
jgi:hypothetical protein